jgi:hypothetical protein
VPQNIEASTMALISGTFIWSYEVGAKISSAIYCDIFELDADHMENYPKVLIAKIPMIFLMMVLTIMIPKNRSILKLAAKLRRDHIKDLMEKRNLKINYD